MDKSNLYFVGFVVFALLLIGSVASGLAMSSVSVEFFAENGSAALVIVGAVCLAVARLMQRGA